MNTPHKERLYVVTTGEIIYIINCWDAYCTLYAPATSQPRLDQALPHHRIYIKAPLRRDISRTIQYFMDETCTGSNSIYNLYQLTHNEALSGYTKHQLQLLIDYFIAQCLLQKRTTTQALFAPSGKQIIEAYYSLNGMEKIIKTLREILSAITTGDISQPTDVNDGKLFADYLVLCAQKTRLIDKLISRKKLKIKDYLKWIFS